MTPEDIKNLSDTVKILSELLDSQPSEWFPVYAALGGAMVGAIASFFPAYFLERYKERRFSRRIQSSLLAEISALLMIVEHRKYHLLIKQIVKYLKAQPPGSTQSFMVQVPEHYSRIYQENCINIGSIDTDVSEKIVIFHHLIDSVVQDVKFGSTTSSGADLRIYEEMDRIFTQALEIGYELVSAHTKHMQSGKMGT